MPGSMKQLAQESGIATLAMSPKPLILPTRLYWFSVEYEVETFKIGFFSKKKKNLLFIQCELSISWFISDKFPLIETFLLLACW